MFKANVAVNIDPSTIFARAQGDMKTAQKWLDERIVKDSNPFVPFDTGLLAGSPGRATQFGSGRIVYDEPYARRLYRGEHFTFSRDKHPKATHHWTEKAKSIFLDSWGWGVAKILGGRWRGGGRT